MKKALLTAILVAITLFSLHVPMLWASLDTKRLRPKIRNISLPFIENHGQINKTVAFYANTLGGTVLITKDGRLIYILSK